MTSTDLVTATDAAKTLGVSVATVSRLANSGELPFHTVGQRKVYSTADLGEFLVANNLEASPVDHKRETDELPEHVAISFFTGAGGLDLGMELAGFESLLYCENNRESRMTITRNRPNAALIGDISNVTADTVRDYAKIPENREIDVMFGGPPCQAFSTAGARRAFDDDRGNIFLTYLDLAKELQPRYLVIENVRGLLSTPFPLRPGGTPVKGGALSLVLKKLEAMGYATSFNLYNSANFGVGQIRERVILVSKRDGTAMPWLLPTHSEDPSWGLPPWTTFADVIDPIAIPRHHYTQFPEKRLKYFRLLSEGQYWKDLPEYLQEPAMGKAYALSGGRTGFYRRIRRDRPCPTLVTTPTMPATDLCHPTELRPLSIEEYKAIQGFPDEWSIAGAISDIYRQLGNAVPVQLGKAIGDAILSDMVGTYNPEPRFRDFPYSRYRNTSDTSWINPEA